MIRYDDRELEAMLDDLESDLVERKESFRGDTPTKARQTVCAFANDIANRNRAGVLFIGVKDDGVPSDLEITEDLINAVADMKSDGRILPMPVLSVEKRAVRGVEMVVVTVLPSDMPPVKFDGRIWVRVGASRRIANEQDERILVERRRYKMLPFDLHPVPIAKIDDLSRVIFENDYLPSAFAPDVIAANNRTFEERLASTKMIASIDDTTPTVLGILVLGKRPQDFLPGAYIQFLRISGMNLTDPIIDEDMIGGTLGEQLTRAEMKLESHNRVAVDVTSGPKHRMQPLYPKAALQQLLYNAVMHRTYESTNAPARVYWYDDRIEITSPGGPYGSVTVDNFGDPGVADYRNPNIAEVLRNMGFVQKFGHGIAIARDALSKNGNPPLEFAVGQGIVNCVIRRSEKPW